MKKVENNIEENQDTSLTETANQGMIINTEDIHIQIIENETSKKNEVG